MLYTQAHIDFEKPRPGALPIALSVSPHTISDGSTCRAHIENMVGVGSWTAPGLIGGNH